MKNYMKTAVAAVAFSFALSASAHAVTVTFGPTPTVAMPNPLADATTGTVFENIVGSDPGVYRSPWQGGTSTINENDATAYYTSVSAQSSATYIFASMKNSISFLWGSPDDYNDLDIILSGGGGTVTVNGTDAQGPVAIEQQFVTLSDVGLFDTVTFRSGQNAFEYANLTAAIPLPAGLPLLAAGLGVLGYVGRRKKSKKA